MIVQRSLVELYDRLFAWKARGRNNERVAAYVTRIASVGKFLHLDRIFEYLDAAHSVTALSFPIPRDGGGRPGFNAGLMFVNMREYERQHVSDTAMEWVLANAAHEYRFWGLGSQPPLVIALHASSALIDEDKYGDWMKPVGGYEGKDAMNVEGAALLHYLVRCCHRARAHDRCSLARSLTHVLASHFQGPAKPWLADLAHLAAPDANVRQTHNLQPFYVHSPLRSSVCTNESVLDPFILADRISGMHLLDQYLEHWIELHRIICLRVRGGYKAETFAWAEQWSVTRLTELLMQRGKGDRVEEALASLTSAQRNPCTHQKQHRIYQ